MKNRLDHSSLTTYLATAFLLSCTNGDLNSHEETRTSLEQPQDSHDELEENRQAVVPDVEEVQGPGHANNDNIDLRGYFPRNRRNIYRRSNGSYYGEYHFMNAEIGSDFDGFQSLYDNLFDLDQAGELLIWKKSYNETNPNCIATYAHIFLGADQSITEVGDWYAPDRCTPEVALGYRKDGSNTGLLWSASGGLSVDSAFHGDINVLRQFQAGQSYQDAGHRAYSHVRMLKFYDSWKPAYGTDADGQFGAGLGPTYHDVVRMVFWHGTSSPQMLTGEQPPNRCPAVPDTPYAGLYNSVDPYNSYAMEYYFAPEVGIVQETFLFTESKYWGDDMYCKGASFEPDHTQANKWSWYLANPE